LLLRVLVLLSSLSLGACGSLFFHPKGSDPGKRWSLVQANTACSAEIERKRWGSLLAMFTYKQRERDHTPLAWRTSWRTVRKRND
jgi:hypothetical protein